MPQSYYVAPIALTEDLVKGATVSGTINGVQVSGTVGAGNVSLYAIAPVSPYTGSPVAKIDGDAGNYQIELEKQPESDLTIHLTQTAPAHAVTIPEEYLELTETNAAIETAQNAANTAQNAASSAQNAASSAQISANTAKTTAETAKATAETAKTTAEAAKATAKNAVHGSIQRLPNATSLNYYLTPSDTTADSIDFVRTFIGLPDASSLEIIVKDKTNPSVTFTPPVYLNHQADFAFARATNVYPHPQITEIGGIVMYSTTSGSTKKFRITVDDTGTIKATEVTEN